MRTDPTSEIVQLLAAYGSFLDRGHHDDWLALFADPSALVIDGRPALETAAARRTLAENAPRGVHMGNQPLVQPSGDGTATSAQTFLFWNVADSTGLAGWYDDELVRNDGQWKFVRRTIRFLEAGPMTETAPATARM